jgi:hypothetical protein
MALDYNLNNFYKEFSYGSNKFDLLMESYQGIFDLLHDVTDQMIDNVVIPDVGIYSYMPVQLIAIDDGLYEINNILIDDSIITNYGMSGMTMDQRITYWNETMPVGDKIAILDYVKKYVYLTTTRQGNPDPRNYEIIDLTLQTISGEILIRNVDYAFSDNKIYLLKNIPSYYKNNKKIIATNIAIDYRSAENIIGNKVFTPYREAITKNEYRDIVQTFAGVGLVGPTVKNLNDTLNILIKSGQFKVVDYPSATGNYKAFWDESIRGDKALNRFDFLIMTPPDIVADANILEMITDYLKLVKLSYTDFYISPYIDILEKYRLNQLTNKVSFLPGFSHTDKISSAEQKKLQSTLTHKDIIRKVEDVVYIYQKILKDTYLLKSKLEIYKHNVILTKKDVIVGRETRKFNQSTSKTDTMHKADDLILKDFKNIKDNIIGTEKKRFSMSFDVLNATQNFDKIRTTEKTQKTTMKVISDQLTEIGNLIFYDNGHIYDNEADVIYFDFNDGKVDTNKTYYETITVKLIKKS